MAELPPKRRQVVRLPRPKPADWPSQEVPEGECFPLMLPCNLQIKISPYLVSFTLCVTGQTGVSPAWGCHQKLVCPKLADWPNQEVPEGVYFPCKVALQPANIN